MLKFSTKAETLAALEGRIDSARVLPQLRFSVDEWHEAKKRLSPIAARAAGGPPAWLSEAVIVRSSGLAEDSESQSLAGHFLSVANVRGEAEIETAIDAVCAKFDGGRNQVFLQPMVSDVRMAGVLLTRDVATGGYYYVVSVDADSGSTDAVTSGSTNKLDTYYHFKGTAPREAWIGRLVDLATELETLFAIDALDIEFAFGAEDQLYLLQVRPLVSRDLGQAAPGDATRKALLQVSQSVERLSAPHPYLLGRKAIFGNMPDWNPAEMIGTRPRALALSLYKELLTDNIWAYQRDNYGYRNLRSFPLLVSFAGMPYIDVRLSFNSFIPSGLDDALAERLVTHYLEALEQDAALHDKVEFDIIYSCYTLDLPDRVAQLAHKGFDKGDQQVICETLRALTNRIIHDQRGLWRRDAAKIQELERRQSVVLGSDLDDLEKIYWLIEDCKRYGTLPFAGLARAGFIAVQFLRSFISTGIFSANEYDHFMESLKTVSSRLGHDLATLTKHDFLQRYGHLRPGTYDILSPRYDEAPDRYFDWDATKERSHAKADNEFRLSLDMMNRLESLLREHQLEHNVLSLLNFIKGAIEGREYAKFVFSRSVSEVLRLLRRYGEVLGFSAEDISHMDINCIRSLYASSLDPKDVLSQSIAEGRRSHAVTRSLALPPIITGADDVMMFQMPRNEPNFVTQKKAGGPVKDETAPKEQLPGAIMVIPSADPGHDWIFSHGIAGFITMYGGANSHMAIRASELGLPAVIGAGEMNFQQWRSAKVVEIDGCARQVRVLQ